LSRSRPSLSGVSLSGACAVALSATSAIAFLLGRATEALTPGSVVLIAIWFLSGLGALIAGESALSGEQRRDRTLGLVAFAYVALCAVALMLLGALS
jgi:hypothetical protein